MKTKNEFWENLISGKFEAMVKESAKGQKINNSKELYNTLRPIMAKHADVECVYGIFMNAKNEVISIEKLIAGTLSQAMIYPREVIKRVLKLKAGALIMAHNHPSGNPLPSPEDSAITFQMLIALKSIGVTLHEHIVIGDTFFSMADNGFIARFNKRYIEAFKY